MKKYKRKKLNLSVKKEFQKWLIIKMLGVVVLSSVVAAVILYFYAQAEITDNFYTAHVKIRRVSDLLLPVIAAGSAISLISGLLLAIFLPQKIAGPLYRMEKRLNDLQDGDLASEITLRRHDILKDFARSLNSSTATLKISIKNIQKTQEELERKHREGADISSLLEQQKKNLHIFRT